jgi:manganese/iron transport system substrate-binding protein
MPGKLLKRIPNGMTLIASVVVIVTCAIFVFLNNEKPSPIEEKTESKLVIATTMIPVENLVREIGGDKVETILIVPEGQSPHTFEPSPQTMKAISNADSIFKIGEIDDWISSLALISKVPEFTIGEGITLMPFKETLVIGEEEDEGGEYDPHYWLSINKGELIAENISQELSRLDKDNIDYYAENLLSFLGRAERADAEIREILSELTNRKIITFHDAWGYFAEDYELEIVAIYQPSPGKEPLPQDVKMLIDKAREYDIKAFFSEVSMPMSSLESIGKDEGIKVVALNPLGVRGEYLGTMIDNAKTIRESLE